MTLNKITISGYRGFTEKQAIDFAIPNGTPGSGLTIITGANNSGKSSILECLRARSGHWNVSFTIGTRNSKIDSVEIIYDIGGREEILRSTTPGSSETQRTNPITGFQIFVLPSRRTFEPYFGKSERTRDDYVRAYGLPPQRASSLPEFSSRLFKTLKNQTAFNEVLKSILGFEPKWTIDQTDQGQYFLKFSQSGHSHSSDGMGEGIVSIFAIADALYDSNVGEVVVIDEPELSLHPTLQKRLANLLLEYAKDRQIVISTHSPYFVILESLANGAHLVRVVNESSKGTQIHQISSESKKNLKSFLGSNLNNPHVFGLNAREIFFQDDGLILTEGQEDVIFYPMVAEQIGMSLPAQLFGWGIGGAENMKLVAKLLQDLGFNKVAGVLDADKVSAIPALREAFPKYFFSTIPTNDIRTKAARKSSDSVSGLLDEKRKIRPEHVDATKLLFQDLKKFMQSVSSVK